MTRRYVGRGQAETAEKVKKTHIDFSQAMYEARLLSEASMNVDIQTLLGKDLRKYRSQEVKRLEEKIRKLYTRGGEEEMTKQYAHFIGDTIILTDSSII